MNHFPEKPSAPVPATPSNGNADLSIRSMKATRRVTDMMPPAPPQRVLVQPPLSKTEKAVMRLLLQGMTEREAAAELERSPNTVHVHIRNIYRKLGVTSRKMLFQVAASTPDLLNDGETNDNEQRQAAA